MDLPRHRRQRGRPCTQELQQDPLERHRVLQTYAEGDYAGLLLFDIDEVERFIVEDDLNYGRSSFHLRQEIAHPQHGEAAVAAQSDGLPSWVGQLRAERVRCGIGHRGPRKRTKESPISAALDMPSEPDTRCARISKKHRVVGGEFAQSRSQEFRAYGLDLGPFLDVVLQEIVERVRVSKLLLQKVLVRFFADGSEQRSDSRLDVANKPKIDGRPAANMFGVLVDLDLFYGSARKKF